MGLGLGRRPAVGLLLLLGLPAGPVPGSASSFLSLPTEAISQLYLTGVGNRSYFDARTIYYLSFSGNQEQVPVIHPVIDYSNVINHPIFGGEVSYKTNFTSLSRTTAAFDPITTLANTNGLCLDALGRSAGAPTLAVPAARHARHLHPADGRGAVAQVLHRSVRPDLDAVRDPARRCDRRLDLQPARRLQLPARRRHPRRSA